MIGNRRGGPVKLKGKVAANMHPPAVKGQRVWPNHDRVSCDVEPELPPASDDEMRMMKEKGTREDERLELDGPVRLKGKTE